MVRMRKKGLLFTLSMFLITVVLLLFAVALHSSTEKNKDRLVVLASTDRIFELSSSVEKGFREILEIYASFDIVVEEDDKVNITITEYISRNKEDWGEELEEKMNGFRDFVELHDDDIIINTDFSFDKELPLILYPYDITYSRSWAVGHVILKIEPDDFDFTGFEITVDTGSSAISDLTLSSHTDSFKFKVRAVDDFGYDSYLEEGVDPTKQNEAKISLIGGNIIKVTVKDTLEIWTNADSPIKTSIKLVGLPKEEGKVAVIYPGSIYNISFSQLGIFKTGQIKIV